MQADDWFAPYFAQYATAADHSVRFAVLSYLSVAGYLKSGLDFAVAAVATAVVASSTVAFADYNVRLAVSMYLYAAEHLKSGLDFAVAAVATDFAVNSSVAFAAELADLQSANAVELYWYSFAYSLS